MEEYRISNIVRKIRLWSPFTNKLSKNEVDFISQRIGEFYEA